MTKLLIGAAALTIALPLMAQGMQPPPVQPPRIDMPSQAGPMDDRVQTRAEVVAKVQQHFAKMDANHDGAIAADELQMMGDHRMAMNDETRRDGPMGDPGAMFDRLDSNHDGSISRDEFAHGREMRVERKMVMNEAPGEAGEHRGMMKMHPMGGGAMGGHMLKMADANNDGRITLQEMTSAALQRFDRADANRNGQITKEERQAMHQQMMQQRGRTAG